MKRLRSVLRTLVSLVQMADAPAAAPGAAQPSAATGSNGLPLLGPFVGQVLAMIKQLLITFLGKTSMSATLPIVGTFAEPMRNFAESFLGKLEAAQSAPAQ